MEIKDRIIEFLKAENISSANFAQEIGVQPSGISHIISGRNKPSLDFIIKMLTRYPSLSTEWLMFGKGNMLREPHPGDLFSNAFSDINERQNLTELSGETPGKGGSGDQLNGRELISTGKMPVNQHISEKRTIRIVVFKSDNTFNEYLPENQPE